MVISHNFYMSLALNEAWRYQILTYPNPAVGATLVSPCGKILAVEAHKKAGFPHAEVEALKQGYKVLTQDGFIDSLESSHDIFDYLLKNHNGCFAGCEMYVTLEPCAHEGKTPSCANLISRLGLQKLYIGVKDDNKKASGGIKILQSADVACEVGILQKECEELLKPFYRYLAGNFVFFKWASRLDGSVEGGVISSLDSRKFVHKLRDVCDLLVIGGNTVRVDRPTLDARLVGGKAPDVLILSNQKEFDRTIPLFGVEGRKVFIEPSLERVREYGCVMVEGGESMLEATKELTHLYLAFVAPKFAPEGGFGNIKEEFFILHTQKSGEDILLWMERK